MVISSPFLLSCCSSYLLQAVGQLLLTLACAGLSNTPSLDVCAAHHSIGEACVVHPTTCHWRSSKHSSTTTLPIFLPSCLHPDPELTRTLAALLASAEGGGVPSWRQLAAVLSDRTLEEMDGLGVMGNGLVRVPEGTFRFACMYPI